MLYLKMWSPSVEMSTSSIRILPSWSSQSLNSACKIEDLPAPVLPTIPTFIPACTLNLSYLMLGSSDSLYLMEAPSNSISPLTGQFCSIYFLSPGFSMTSSLSISVYSINLWVDVIKLSIIPNILMAIEKTATTSVMI